MKFRTSREHLCELLFIFALFFVFAVCAVTVLLVSASSYESTVRRTGENYDIRTTLTYLSQKIRQNDEYGAIHAGTFEDYPALILHQKTENSSYTTYIYLMDGQLKELVALDGSNAAPESGQTILENTSVSIEETDSGLIRFTLTDSNGISYELTVSPKSSEGSDPDV
ncbi:MAG TPA: DUF4860 domain-containing protein [Candidatus Onthocola gallistercoris]|uniref:DUF4860 domain-containing protein n=1 Tax=Candidatus Onthocola gallistercoris TaxID=2840876 RepID=A0A9D1HF65_9FIRM|nr:DUF4860 domain-containing protein [Candidatus Onthocola gallistercoris]